MLSAQIPMWINLTPDSLNGRIAAPEIAKVTQMAGNGLTVQQVIDQVVNEVRGYVAKAGPVGLPGTIPDELQDAALSIIILRYVSQVPGASQQTFATESRKTAAENARLLLRDVAARKFLVTPPETAAPEQATRPSMVTVDPGNHGSSREDFRRL